MDHFDYHGIVADYCPICDRVRVFHVANVRKSSWLGFHTQVINLCKQCDRCRQLSSCDAVDYRKIVEELEEMDLNDLLMQTNPRLKESMPGLPLPNLDIELLTTGFIPDNSRSVTKSRVAISSQGEELSQLLEDIRPYERFEPGYGLLQSKLTIWSSLTDAERRRLAKKVRTFVAKRRAEEFLVAMAPGCPRYVGLWMALVAAPLVFLPFIAILLLLLSQQARERDFGGCFMHPFLWSAVAFGLSCKYGSDWAARRFFERTLVPFAEDAGIDLDVLVDVLCAGPTLPMIPTSDFDRMRRKSGVLIKLLRGQNKIL